MIEARDILNMISECDIKVDVKNLDLSISLRDQGLDSLDMTTLLFSIEEKFNIQISDEDLDQGKLSSIDAIVTFLNKVRN